MSYNSGTDDYIIQKHWIVRVGDGKNFKNSKFPFWGVKATAPNVLNITPLHI
jgi:hypothetical protein